LCCLTECGFYALFSELEEQQTSNKKEKSGKRFIFVQQSLFSSVKKNKLLLGEIAAVVEGLPRRNNDSWINKIH
jgi:hypothetical protein